MINLPIFGFTPDEPLGRNPFRQNDKRHCRWAAASRLAKEYLALHHSTILGRMPAEAAAREEHQAWMVDLFAERFSIMAAAILAEFGLTYEGVVECEKVVDSLAEFTLAEARKIDPSRSRIVTVTFFVELQIRLTQYREHSVGQAYKWIREAEESSPIRRNQAPVDQQASVAKGNDASPSTPWLSGATGANRQARILTDDKISSYGSPKEFAWGGERDRWSSGGPAEARHPNWADCAGRPACQNHQVLAHCLPRRVILMRPRHDLSKMSYSRLAGRQAGTPPAGGSSSGRKGNRAKEEDGRLSEIRIHAR